MELPTETARVRRVLVLNRDKLDELRRANGIESETKLAKVLGVSYTTLWRVSNGEVAPSNEFITAVLLAFPHVEWPALFSFGTVEKAVAA